MDKREPGGIVDGDMQEVMATQGLAICVLGLTRSTEQPMAAAHRDPTQLFHVHVKEFAGPLPHVVDRHRVGDPTTGREFLLEELDVPAEDEVVPLEHVVRGLAQRKLKAAGLRREINEPNGLLGDGYHGIRAVIAESC